MPASLLLVIKSKILRKQWPWPNEAHIAPKYIPEFRELI
tara:strand:- start:492 stop:608 length:117 start_codon:yes stop_codon:yes gene_type:complete